MPRSKHASHSRHRRPAQGGRARRHHFRLLRASAGDRGDAPPRRGARRAVCADRGDVEPGQSGRRLHRHDARPTSATSSRGIADRVGFPRDRVVLGGDHLGPNAWTSRPADEAMAKAEVMVADYVARRLPQDPSRLLDVLRRRSGAASRTHRSPSVRRGSAGPPKTHRRRARRARRATSSAPRCRCPAARTRTSESWRSPPRRPRSTTIEMHREVFAQAGLASAWDRVIATVVQPGVEFDHHKVVDYVPREGRRAQRCDRAGRPPRLRSAFDRLPDPGRARRAGARSFRDPEGRPGPDLRAARGAVGARRHRARAAAAGAPGQPSPGRPSRACTPNPRTGRNYYDGKAPRSISSSNTA